MPPEEAVERILIRRGGVVGILAWGTGLLLTYSLAQLLSSGLLLHHIDNAPVAGTLYGYLLIHTWLPVPVSHLGDARYTLIPFVVLVGAGYLLGANADASAGRSLAHGATVTVGYFPMVVATLRLPPPNTVVVDPVIPFVWAGLLFPAVGGAVGGHLAVRAAAMRRGLRV
ncbi:hypothetical protein ACFQGT_18170 [Natrialbaceae archaeon GCM10025810]|uniref:hypothetical protein n=1 Tax=Halovalidus salilacus TaxID=3075124 RepID=UPI00360A8953